MHGLIFEISTSVQAGSTRYLIVDILFQTKVLHTTEIRRTQSQVFISLSIRLHDRTTSQTFHTGHSLDIIATNEHFIAMYTTILVVFSYEQENYSSLLHRQLRVAHHTHKIQAMDEPLRENVSIRDNRLRIRLGDRFPTAPWRIHAVQRRQTGG
jgi:hypothetical protein